jgi:hypothetical protein
MKKQDEESKSVPQSEQDSSSSPDRGPSTSPDKDSKEESDPLLRAFQVWKAGGKEALRAELEKISSSSPKESDKEGQTG